MSDFNIARKNMVHNQLMTNNVVEETILNAFKIIPREIFLPFEKRDKAYLDEDIEIVTDRYLMEPRIIGNIIKLSKIKKTDIVMDLACSSGYTSAILSKLSKKVYGLDNKNKLIEQANFNIKKLNINNASFISKNPIAGLKKKFDLIFIFCGVEHIPSNLYECLKNNGGSLITVFYENNIGKIHVAKKLENKISRKSYINAQTPVIKEFKTYFESECRKAADKLKTPKGKAGKLAKLYEGQDLIEKHEKDLINTIDLYKNLQLAKEMFIRKLEKGERFGTYLRTENGYKITAPEGYVAIQEGKGAVKLVDRLTFSVANFNVEKNWVGGDGK